MNRIKSNIFFTLELDSFPLKIGAHACNDALRSVKGNIFTGGVASAIDFQ